jgi:hypothetical protein
MAQTTDHQKAMARAYSQAGQILRRRHMDEFKSILGEIYEREGLDVVRRRTQDQIEKDRIADAVKILQENGVSVEV